MDYITNLIKNTITGKLILVNAIIFLFIIWYQQIDPILINYLFLNIPQVLSPGIILSNFAHIQPFHILLNLYGLYLLGPMIESISGKKTFIKLIIFCMIFSSLGVWIFSPHPVLGFSGILMSMLAFVFFKYKQLGHIREQVGIFLVLNIVIGVLPGISFAGHLFGAIAGYFFYIISEKTNI
ncbi:rhomboid family intramembrane serine protease [Candidatus Absconditicoccus praedator]|uniref:rhomboid family intramembrane serine protease n=1 Tax=Candidatus Absconditicoccus praedator TaxID=2735562 RepID=UPI001E3DFAB2|nr:rhomboid family intramembrane serine protease [Candidatus Absconditicoccus praedator]UFX82814.1 rhomboid family intramembrane serine protease [Candidatus Absconditicoccus praedator]